MQFIAFKAQYPKAETNKLKSIIQEQKSSLGSSPSGIAWCLKALHPSDPVIDCDGIPDKCSASTFLYNYQSQYTLSPAAGATGTWEFQAALLPNPLQFMAVNVTDSIDTLGKEYNFTNTQLSGPNWKGSMDWILNQCSAWRLAYMSVTCYQDGPDLANQGTIVAAQAPLHERYRIRLSPSGTAGAALQPVTPSWVVYNDSDIPTFAGTQSMPNAYFARSKDGCYMPLKLEKDTFRWRSAADQVIQATPVAICETQIQLPTIDTYPWPHQNTGGADPGYYNFHPANFATGTWNVLANQAPGMLSSTVGRICAKNLDVATSFTFYVRCGLEMQVRTNSALAPNLKVSPPYDPEALRSYFAISRELKDAYPASYNDLGKLWDVISGAARFALPHIAKMGPYGAAVATLGTGALMVGNTVRAYTTRDKPPAATIERARAQVNAIAAPKVVYRPVVQARRRVKVTAANRKTVAKRTARKRKPEGFVYVD